MNLNIFIEQIISAAYDTISLPYVTMITAQEYPVLFLSACAHQLQRNKVLCENLDVVGMSVDTIQRILMTTFLGTSKIYVIAISSEIDAKHRARLFQFLSNYTGPHRVICCANSDDVVQYTFASRIDIPVHVDKSLVQALAKLKGLQSNPHINRYIIDLLQKQPALSCDMACMVLDYVLVLGKNTNQFFNDWFDRIVPRSESFFTLSQHFFAKEGRLFLASWDIVKHNYPIQFWISFWSDQIWRAACFVAMQNSNQLLEAKKISYKLPFSFIQKQYKRYTLAELQQAHTRLCSLDEQIKNGVSDDIFESWIITFITNGFA